jgi:hypothetical protein
LRGIAQPEEVIHPQIERPRQQQRGLYGRDEAPPLNRVDALAREANLLPEGFLRELPGFPLVLHLVADRVARFGMVHLVGILQKWKVYVTPTV